MQVCLSFLFFFWFCSADKRNVIAFRSNTFNRMTKLGTDTNWTISNVLKSKMKSKKKNKRNNNNVKWLCIVLVISEVDSGWFCFFFLFFIFSVPKIKKIIYRVHCNDTGWFYYTYVVVFGFFLFQIISVSLAHILIHCYQFPNRFQSVNCPVVLRKRTILSSVLERGWMPC